VVGDFSMLQETLQLRLDGTYCFTIYGCFGVSFVETGSWSLNRNLIDFTVNPSSMNSGRPMRWAYATIENDRLIIIPDYFADWYIDRADMSLSFSRTIVATEVEAREQSDCPQATDLHFDF
jgi:hypothetical protein